MKYIVLTIVSMFLVQLSIGQTLSGKVVDKKTKETIPFASVFITGVEIGTITDSIGNFEFQSSIPKEVTLRVSASLFEAKLVTIQSNQVVTIELEPSHLELDEVILIMPTGVMQRDNTVRVDRLKLNDLSTIPASNLADAMSNLNGVQQASMGAGISKPVIRGMQGVRVLTAWNGMRIENQQWGADHGMAISQLGIESVEVIKGPSSLLYGADAFGGVVYLAEEKFSKQNAYSVELNSKFETANLGTTNTAMIKLSKNHMRFNLGALYSNNADYKMSNGKFLSDSRYRDMGMKARFGVNKDNWVMQVNYMYSRSYIGIPGHTHDSIPNPEDFMKTEQGRERSIPAQSINNHMVQMENKFFLGSDKIQFMLGYTQNSLLEYEDKVTIPGLGMLLRNGLYHAQYQKDIGSWNVSAGLQGMYQVNSNDESALEQLIPNFNQFDNGLYAIANYRSKSNFSIQFGGRYDVRVLNSGGFTETYSSPNFSIGGKYFWGETLKNTLRFNVSSGFRAPHVSELLVDGVHHGALRYEVGNPNLKSERATQFDVNYELEMEHLSVVLNPFYNYIQNFTQIVAQDSLIDMMPVYFYEQIDQAQLYGVDVGFHYHPHFAHWLHIESSYALIYGESLSGENMSLMPQPKLSNLIRLQFKKKQKFNLDEVVIKHAHYFAQDRITAYESASVAYDVIDAGLKFKWYMKNPIEINLGVKNALNAQYVNHLSRLKNIGVYDMGRNFYVSLIYQFNGKLSK